MRLRHVLGIIVLLIGVGLLGLLLTRQHATTASSNRSRLTVVAAENFWGNIASQLGGSHVQVTSIITDPTADPHLYESDARTASLVNSANLVITNGLGYDDFMDKLLSTSKNTHRRVIQAAGVLHISGADANPHLWYYIPRVPEVAAAIARGYEAADPAHTADYERNFQNFDRSLRPLLATINTIKQTYAGTAVAYTEPVPGYLLQAAGLSVKTPEGFAKSIEDGTDPSPADTTAMETLLTSKTARILFYNSQATSPVTEHVRDLAIQNDVPVIGVTETVPATAKNYQAWQQDQLDQILKALERKR